MFQWLLHGYAVALGLKLCRNCLEVFHHLNRDPPTLSFLINSLKITYLVLDVPPECINQGLSSGAQHPWTSGQTTWLWRHPVHHHLSHQNNDPEEVASTRLQLHLIQNIPRGTAYKQQKHLPYLPPETNNRQIDLITRVNTPIKSPESCYLGIDLTGVDNTAFSEF